MKVFNTTFLVLATACAVTASVAPEQTAAIGEKKADDNKVARVSGDIRKLDEEVGAEGKKGGYQYYFTGSCTCAQDAWEDIMNAATDAISDCIPLEEETQRTLPPYIQALEHCAMEWLVALDCGCDDDYTVPLYLYKKTSTFQCCCDVDAVKDVVIHHINEVKNTWMLAVGMDVSYMTSVIGKICEFGRLDNILDRATFALYNILDNYASSLFKPGYYPRCQLDYDVYCPGATPKP
mmetsp:Transcript_8133/g.14891  ORF Transcript_8133/g.14891 Transcript_8133/m.14891 type:complete len:236 (-) Transcript_8133:116-823(-)|eukprot:CAMPEP_0197444508 /NCGR_PEP_ID=MMETSP1175-20131217/9983_1 /TAXON_ID=1003142 /ORGANISM="Triceratium dubium, Strain CCMP147" /LENGTH=235 /DNA_ID=CAMNT_0042975313 /DNA_START=120 /DNA_END=827 /DNA_ORIENTATION=-